MLFFGGAEKLVVHKHTHLCQHLQMCCNMLEMPKTHEQHWETEEKQKENGVKLTPYKRSKELWHLLSINRINSSSTLHIKLCKQTNHESAVLWSHLDWRWTFTVLVDNMTIGNENIPNNKIWGYGVAATIHIKAFGNVNAFKVVLPAIGNSTQNWKYSYHLLMLMPSQMYTLSFVQWTQTKIFRKIIS